MSKTISLALKAIIASTDFTNATCILLERLDGVKLGFTTYDQKFSYDVGSGTVQYKSQNGFFATSIKQTSGTSIDNLDIRGAVSSIDISDSDLIAGKYDGAFLTVFTLDPTALSAGHMVLQRGRVGEIKLNDGEYTAELRSLGQIIASQIGEYTSPTCRVKALGDARCTPASLFGNGNNLSYYQVSTVVGTYTASPPTVTLTGTFPTQVTTGSDTNWYNDGVLSMTSGLNITAKKEIKTWSYASSVLTIHLYEPFGYDLIAGDTGVIQAGCNRTIDICHSRFGNEINFQGEPNIPGIDKILTQGAG